MREPDGAEEVGHFIGGEHVSGRSGRFSDLYQPMTGEVIGRLADFARHEGSSLDQMSWCHLALAIRMTEGAGERNGCGGEHVSGRSGRFSDLYQPMTGEVIGRLALASRDR
jgi:acyl-CoA reductase-like NAD-dependent aldehyde dehydrogenase